MANFQETFKEFDFVWAKLMNFNHWPAIILKPVPEAPAKPTGNYQWVYFLGDHNYAWICEKNIKPYEEFKEQFQNKKVQKAMKEMDKIIRKKTKYPDYEIPISEYIGKKLDSHKMVKNESASVAKSLATAGRKTSNSDTSEASLETFAEITDTPELAEPEPLKTIGFFAGQDNAEYLLKNLILVADELYVWFENGNWAKQLKDIENYAKERNVVYKKCDTPQAVIANSCVTFSCLSNQEKAIATMNEILIADKIHECIKETAYIEMTNVDAKISKKFNDQIEGRDGLYLEAMIQGSQQTQIVIIAAGMQIVFEALKPCFEAIGEAIFLGEEVGLAADFQMAMQMLRGSLLTAFSEGLALANQSGFSLNQMKSLFKETKISSEYIDGKVLTMMLQNYSKPHDLLKNLQEDLSRAMRINNENLEFTPLAANANQILTSCSRKDNMEKDSSVVFKELRY